MRLHPALTMAMVWLLCAAAFWLLPLHLIERDLSWQGALMQCALIGAFCASSIVVTGLRADATACTGPALDTTRAQRLLMVVSAIATIGLLLDAASQDVFDLAASYSARSESADALLRGAQSKSSIWFQIAFVTYPAAYVFTVLHVMHAPRLQPVRLAAFGLAPFVLASLVMGGRMPILYGLAVAWLAMRQRRRLTASVDGRDERAGSTQRTLLAWTLLALVLAALAYFSQVFLVRAEASGGTEQMFELAQQRWGIAFSGPIADRMVALLGMDLSYLIFIFTWYGVQGLVIGNELLSGYADPAQWGAYGIDLISALVRRLDPQRLASGFDALLLLDAYGFFPSAWGALFVDLRYGAIVASIAWGMVAGLAYHRIVAERRMRWQVVGPFISIGVLASTINTPLGFTNGLVTHVWLIVAWLLLRPGAGTTPDGTGIAMP